MYPEDLIISIFLINSDDSYSFVGTGFIISLQGLFLSAGHVFKQGNFDKNMHVCAFPSRESQLIKISYLSINYKEREEQKGPVFYEFAVGKIDKKFDEFIVINSKRPQFNDQQKIIGYRNINIERNLNRFSLSSNGTINLSDIQFEKLTTNVIDRFATINKDLSDYSAGSYTPQNWNNKKYNNCFTVNRRLHKGVSGAPVLNNDNTLSGVFFGGFPSFSFILATKFIKKNIRKTTKFRFNRHKINSKVKKQY